MKLSVIWKMNYNRKMMKLKKSKVKWKIRNKNYTKSNYKIIKDHMKAVLVKEMMIVILKSK